MVGLDGVTQVDVQVVVERFLADQAWRSWFGFADMVVGDEVCIFVLANLLTENCFCLGDSEHFVLLEFFHDVSDFFVGFLDPGFEHVGFRLVEYVDGFTFFDSDCALISNHGLCDD